MSYFILNNNNRVKKNLTGHLTVQRFTTQKRQNFTRNIQKMHQNTSSKDPSVIMHRIIFASYSIKYIIYLIMIIRLGLNEFLQKFLVELYRDSGLFLQSFGYFQGGLFNETALKFIEELIQSKPVLSHSRLCF